MGLSLDNYITSSCSINGHVLCKNEQVLFENKTVNLNEFLVSAYRHFEINYPRFYKMDNLSKLGWLATEILLDGSFQKDSYAPEAVGIVLANASSSLDTDMNYFETTKGIASPGLFVYTLPNIVIGEISIRHHFKGENAFFISDDFDAGFIEQYVTNLLNNNILQSCICGWVELLGEQYKTVLFLIEKKQAGEYKLFTQENINKIYQIENG